MKYKNVPGTNIQIPSYQPIPWFATVQPTPEQTSKNLRCLRKLKIVLLGGAK